MLSLSGASGAILMKLDPITILFFLVVVLSFAEVTEIEHAATIYATQRQR